MQRHTSLLLFLLFLSSCGTYQPTQPGSTLLTSEMILQQHGSINHQEVRKYLAYLEERLSVAAPYKKRLHIETTLIDSPEPFAVSSGSGVVLISRGLFLSLQSEAELAFVLAHEYGHEYLGHTALTADELPAYNEDLEMAADSFALGLIGLAGYDPRVAPYALIHHAQSSGLDEDFTALRISKIRAQIQRSGWQPPGTVNRRDFNTIKKILFS